MATQDELKRMAAEKAVEWIPENEYIGIGTGSTVAFFIEALAKSGKDIRGAVSSSKQTSALLAQYQIPEINLNQVHGVAVYIDSADEINHSLQMIKGAGGALVNEKIVAAAANQFICIADESKYVAKLGRFPVPVEVIGHARSLVSRQLLKLGGEPTLRLGFTSDNGNEIVDVHGLSIYEPVKMEIAINAMAGVVDNGLFAARPADLLLLACADGVKTIRPNVTI
ncbi:ribose-5-phosphate isomerase RpiA [Stenoxybacter acetivorans]|uniref:ribose-5-phosphate isomerase RpiA n=1 Tax=Stenoxybacter acetivorans TaxID=422441 RepID=UPI00056C5FFD|nr:ribose-5-phosphate isomerase RpiA [Stenoxybacter acetivorans]